MAFPGNNSRDKVRADLLRLARNGVNECGEPASDAERRWSDQVSRGGFAMAWLAVALFGYFWYHVIEPGTVFYVISIVVMIAGCAGAIACLFSHRRAFIDWQMSQGRSRDEAERIYDDKYGGN